MQSLINGNHPQILNSITILKIISILVLIVFSIIFVKLCLNIEFVQDDAFITFRYVENFISGHGLVYNPGEYVEGYTSFLWVIILSVPALLNLDYVSISQIFSVSFGVLLLPVTYLISDSFSISNSKGLSRVLFNLLPVAMLALTGGLHYWSISGMETSLFVLLVSISVLLYLRNPESRSYIIFLLLASLTRPEGILFTLIIISHYLHISYKSGNKIFTNPTTIKNLLFYILPISIYFIFRLSYYGDLLPNTFFAKTGFGSFYLERGTEYLYNTITTYFYYGLLLLLPTILLLEKELRERAALFYLMIGILFIGLILIGGDVLPLHRFVLPVLPLIFVLFSKLLEHIISFIKNKSIHLISSLMVFLTIILMSTNSYKNELPHINDLREYELGLVKKMRIYSEWINDRIIQENKSVTVCLSTIGAFSYYSKAEVIDLIGLTDEYIAHNPKEVPGIADSINVIWKERRYNVDYVMEREPDYIIMPAGAKPSAYPESALFTKEKFIKGYYPQLFFSEALDQFMPVFTKKSYAGIYNNTALSCNVGFIDNYISAQNDFLKFISNGNTELLKSIKENCKRIIKQCPDFESYALTVWGYAFYHSGDTTGAMSKFIKAVDLDEYNSLASIYLFKIYSNNGAIEERSKYLKLLKKHSPDALINLKSKL